MATADAAPRPRHWSLPAEPPRTASAWTPVTDGDRAAVDPNGASTLVATPEALGITSADVLLGEQHVLSDPPWLPSYLAQFPVQNATNQRPRPSAAGGGARVATTIELVKRLGNWHLVLDGVTQVDRRLGNSLLAEDVQPSIEADEGEVAPPADPTETREGLFWLPRFHEQRDKNDNRVVSPVALSARLEEGQLPPRRVSVSVVQRVWDGEDSLLPAKDRVVARHSLDPHYATSPTAPVTLLPYPATFTQPPYVTLVDKGTVRQFEVRQKDRQVKKVVQAAGNFVNSMLSKKTKNPRFKLNDAGKVGAWIADWQSSQRSKGALLLTLFKAAAVYSAPGLGGAVVSLLDLKTAFGDDGEVPPEPVLYDLTATTLRITIDRLINTTSEQRRDGPHGATSRVAFNPMALRRAQYAKEAALLFWMAFGEWDAKLGGFNPFPKTTTAATGVVAVAAAGLLDLVLAYKEGLRTAASGFVPTPVAAFLGLSQASQVQYLRLYVAAVGAGVAAAAGAKAFLDWFAERRYAVGPGNEILESGLDPDWLLRTRVELTLLFEVEEDSGKTTTFEVDAPMAHAIDAGFLMSGYTQQLKELKTSVDALVRALPTPGLPGFFGQVQLWLGLADVYETVEGFAFQVRDKKSNKTKDLVFNPENIEARITTLLFGPPATARRDDLDEDAATEEAFKAARAALAESDEPKPAPPNPIVIVRQRQRAEHLFALTYGVGTSFVDSARNPHAQFRRFLFLYLNALAYPSDAYYHFAQFVVPAANDADAVAYKRFGRSVGVVRRLPQLALFDRTRRNASGDDNLTGAPAPWLAVRQLRSDQADERTSAKEAISATQIAMRRHAAELEVLPWVVESANPLVAPPLLPGFHTVELYGQSARAYVANGDTLHRGAVDGVRFGALDGVFPRSIGKFLAQMAVLPAARPPDLSWQLAAAGGRPRGDAKVLAALKVGPATASAFAAVSAFAEVVAAAAVAHGASLRRIDLTATVVQMAMQAVANAVPLARALADAAKRCGSVAPDDDLVFSCVRGGPTIRRALERCVAWSDAQRASSTLRAWPLVTQRVFDEFVGVLARLADGPRVNPVGLPFTFVQTLWLHNFPALANARPSDDSTPLATQAAAAAAAFARVRALASRAIATMENAAEGAREALVDVVCARPVVFLLADSLPRGDAFASLAVDATARVARTQRDWQSPKPQFAAEALRLRAARLNVNAVEALGAEPFAPIADPGALSKLVDHFLRLDEPTRVRFVVPPGSEFAGAVSDLSHAAHLEDTPVWMDALRKATLELRVAAAPPSAADGIATPVDAATLEREGRSWHPYVLDMAASPDDPRALRWSLELAMLPSVLPLADATLPLTVLEAIEALRLQRVPWDAARREARRVLLWNVDRTYQLLLLHAAMRPGAASGAPLAIDVRSQPELATVAVAAAAIAIARAAAAIGASVPVTVHVGDGALPAAESARRIVDRVADQRDIRAAPLVEVVAALAPALAATQTTPA